MLTSVIRYVVMTFCIMLMYVSIQSVGYIYFPFHGHRYIFFLQQLVCCTFSHPTHVRHGIHNHICEIASYVSSV